MQREERCDELKVCQTNERVKGSVKFFLSKSTSAIRFWARLGCGKPGSGKGDLCGTM